MKRLKLAVLMTLALAPFAANSTVIDFTAETPGGKANGYTVSGVSFSDSLGGDLFLNDFGAQSFGNALGVFNDDPSVLEMSFSGVHSSLSITFGNDDACCSNAGDVAVLTLFLANVQVGQTTVVLNRNDAPDQTITLNGINFDEATFAYANPALQPINLIEIVDNITFDGAAVPLPGTLALLGLGLLGLGASRRR